MNKNPNKGSAMMLDKFDLKTFFISTFLLISMLTCLLAGEGLAQMELTYDLSLDIAKENSPVIRRNRLNLERSRELLKAQQAALKSHFSLQVNPFSYENERTFNRFISAWSKNETKESATRFNIRQPIALTDGTLNLINNWSWQDSYSDYQGVRNKSYTNYLYLAFEQPIFTYNRTKLETRSLELDLERNQLELSIQELSLELQVARSFYAVYRSKLNLEIAGEEKKNVQESYNIINNKVEAGLAPLEELYQAELDLATSESTVLEREVALEDALDEFKQLIGMPVTDNVTVLTNMTYQPVEVSLEKAVGNGVDKRMELRQKSIDIENAQFNLTQTSALNEFKGDINLSYGIMGNDESLGDIFEKPTRNQSFSISFDIPLWDWGEKKSRIKADQATIASQKISLEDQQTTIIVGIRQAYRAFQSYGLQIEIAEKGLRNAELAYEINLERYKNGDLSSIDLSRFQEQLSQKKMEKVAALIDYKLALLDIKTQSLWDFEKDKPVIP